MSQEKKDKLEKLFDALFDSSKDDAAEIKSDLASAGVNYQRIESEVQKLLDAEARRKKMSWLEEAQKTRAKIGDIFEKKSKEVRARFKSVGDLVDAIQSGQFGSPLQQKANAFFRNQDRSKLSDADLISFVEDCQLLDALSSDDESDK